MREAERKRELKLSWVARYSTKGDNLSFVKGDEYTSLFPYWIFLSKVIIVIQS